MKDKKPYIEEMAKAVCHLDRTCDECMTSFECKAMMYAKRFYEAGYRKASDVAREIFEEIEKLLKENQCTLLPPYRSEITDWKTVFRLKLASDIAKLKKKYTESEKDNG